MEKGRGPKKAEEKGEREGQREDEGEEGEEDGFCLGKMFAQVPLSPPLFFFPPSRKMGGWSGKRKGRSCLRAQSI